MNFYFEQRYLHVSLGKIESRHDDIEKTKYAVSKIFFLIVV